eukprot:m.9557 g.9557  ORF g.9557 m.9557 type:complete len:64 (+) comp3491_c0_seq1:166-357(+)
MIVLLTRDAYSWFYLFSSVCLVQVFKVNFVNGLPSTSKDTLMKQTMKERIIQRELERIVGKET